MAPDTLHDGYPFLVGEGLEDESIVEELLDVERVSAKPIYDLASEDGLVLFDATYPDIDLVPDQDALTSFRAALADAQRRAAVLACMAGVDLTPAVPSAASASKHKKLLSRAREPSLEE